MPGGGRGRAGEGYGRLAREREWRGLCLAIEGVVEALALVLVHLRLPPSLIPPPPPPPSLSLARSLRRHGLAPARTTPSIPCRPRLWRGWPAAILARHSPQHRPSSAILAPQASPIYTGTALPVLQSRTVPTTPLALPNPSLPLARGSSAIPCLTRLTPSSSRHRSPASATGRASARREGLGPAPAIASLAPRLGPQARRTRR